MEWVVIVALSLILWIAWTIETSRRRKAKRSAYIAAIEEQKNALLRNANEASLTVLSCSEHGYRPVSKEHLLAVHERISRLEYKSTGRRGYSSSSISIPIAKGVRYRIGSGSVRSDKSWQVTARGRLLITDKALVFESREKNERIPWTQVADVELLLDGFRVHKRSGPPRMFVVNNPDAEFAAVLELMLDRVG